MTEEQSRSCRVDALSTSSEQALRKQAEEGLERHGEHVEELLKEKTAELEGAQANLRRLATVVRDSNDAVTLQDMTGRILAWNRGAELMYGWPETEALEMNIADIVPAERKQEQLELVEQVKAGAPVESMQTQRLTKDGRTLDVWLVVTRLVDNRGNTVAMGTTERDITDRKRAQEELVRHRDHLEELVKERTAKLEAAQDDLLRHARLAALGKLTGTVSHEIRNPLGTIRSSVFLIRERVRGQDPAVDRALDRAERNIQRCDRILEELLCYARTNCLDPEPTDIDKWLAGVVDEVHIPETIQLTKKLCCGVNIAFDRERMRRCVTNVIANACQAMAWDDAEGEWELTVETCCSDGRVQIVVRDTGVGIPPDELEKVFEPLYSTKTFGVGLGLPIVKQIVEQHEGGLEIESQPGQGTAVTLWLPGGEQEA